MDITEIIGIAAGVCTSSSAIPQVVKTIKEKKAGQVSWFMFSVLIAGNALWTYYGVLKNDPPIIITNAFALLVDITMIALKFKYKNSGKE